MSKKESSKKHAKKSAAPNNPAHITTGNVFADLGFSPVESRLLAFRTDVHSLIIKQVKRHGYDRRQLERIFDEPQPRISEIMTGKISKMSLDKLICYLFKLGAEPTHHKEESGIKLPELRSMSVSAQSAVGP